MMVVAAGAVAFVGLSLTALAVIVHESGSAKTESGAADAPSDTINVSSGKIWEEYGVNALQADQKYKGKTVWWKGSIGQGELRPDGDGYVLGQGIPDSAPGMPGPGRWTSRGPPPATKPATPPGGWTPTCICKIAPDAVAAFSKVTIGAEVTIVARCQGMRKDASAWQGYSVLFDQCRLK